MLSLLSSLSTASTANTSIECDAVKWNAYCFENNDFPRSMELRFVDAKGLRAPKHLMYGLSDVDEGSKLVHDFLHELNAEIKQSRPKFFYTSDNAESLAASFGVFPYNWCSPPISDGEYTFPMNGLLIHSEERRALCFNPSTICFQSPTDCTKGRHDLDPLCAQTETKQCVEKVMINTTKSADTSDDGTDWSKLLCPYSLRARFSRQMDPAFAPSCPSFEAFEQQFSSPPLGGLQQILLEYCLPVSFVSTGVAVSCLDQLAAGNVNASGCSHSTCGFSFSAQDKQWYRAQSNSNDECADGFDMYAFDWPSNVGAATENCQLHRVSHPDTWRVPTEYLLHCKVMHANGTSIAGTGEIVEFQIFKNHTMAAAMTASNNQTNQTGL